ncbi:MAG TPA: hemerythrin domain-containing protein [Verrucomicrobiae bacterium]|jgi:iron-sulfur cluster repair protein YtfE (RIC family)|nr:hemerythrin domain-containing protein [Verrucomicrobiae bacterium]
MKTITESGSEDRNKRGKPGDSPTGLLHEDHQKVQALFHQYEKAASGQKTEIFENVAKELKIHTAVEKEIFYPVVWENTNADELVKKAAEEHRVLDSLLEELEDMKVDDADFSAKFNMLQASMAHHIEAEEAELFPKFEQSPIDQAAVAKSMRERRKALREKAA